MMLGLITLTLSQVMLMEAAAYWMMVVSRILQGISSSVVWVVGLAMLLVSAHVQIA
jgi:predicted MFS family arabinose efflux permease